METTEPMTAESAVELLLRPEEVVNEESQSDVEVTDEAEEEQPVEDSDGEAEEVEDTADDAEEESEDETEEDDEAEDNEDEVDVEEDDQEPEEELFTVKVDGVEEQVTLEDLKRGYSGQKYVQKGMQQAAEQRKAAEQVYETLLRERQNLAVIAQQVQQGGLTPPQEPTKEMFDTDPIGYMEAKMEYDEQLKTYNETLGAFQRQMQQQSEAELNARKLYSAQEAQKLRELIPELTDPQKAEAFRANIYEAAAHYGYTEVEMANITNHRDMLVLRDAMRYRQLQSKGEIVREKTKKARKPIKAGAKKVVDKKDVVRKQRDKLRKSGSVDDALALMLNPNLRK